MAKPALPNLRYGFSPLRSLFITCRYLSTLPVYTHRPTGQERERDRDRERNRDKDRDRQTDRAYKYTINEFSNSCLNNFDLMLL